MLQCFRLLAHFYINRIEDVQIKVNRFLVCNVLGRMSENISGGLEDSYNVRIYLTLYPLYFIIFVIFSSENQQHVWCNDCRLGHQMLNIIGYLVK